MDFGFTEEQQLLRDSFARYIEREYTFEKRRAIQRSAEGFSREVWSAFAEMGLLGLTTPEEYGGYGGSPIDTLVVSGRSSSDSNAGRKSPVLNPRRYNTGSTSSTPGERRA